MNSRAWMLGCVLLWALPARADVFVVAPPWYQGQDGAELSLRIARVVEAELSRQGHKALPPERAAALVAPERRVSCSGGDCAERYRTAAQASAAVVVRLYRAKEGSGPATSFQIGIQPELGLEYTHGEVFGEGLRDDVILRVLRESLHAYRRGPGPWLQVSGAPRDATVYLDDRQVGNLPLLFRATAGTHRLRVEARGFAPKTRVLTLTAPGALREETFALEPERIGKEADGKPAGPRARGLTDLRLSRRERAGVSLMAVGAPALALGAVWLGMGLGERDRTDRCVRADDGVVPCGRRSRPPDGKAELMLGAASAAVGAAALVTGAVFLLRPRKAARLSLDVGDGRAVLQWRGDL